MDELDLIVRSMDNVNLVHCQEEEVNLIILAIDKVDLVHRSDNKRSTSSLWSQG